MSHGVEQAGYQGPDTISLPCGYGKSETDLIAVLDYLMGQFVWLDDHEDCCARIRAADWLAAKYGSRAP